MSFLIDAAIDYHSQAPLPFSITPTSSTFLSTIFPNLSYFFNQHLPSQPKGVNQQWKEIVGPRVIKSESDKGEDAKNSYDLEKIIEKINAYRAEGKTVCLFVGRTPGEPLPSDLDEAEENEVWVSGDIALLSSEESRQIAPSSNRLHLWLDFNQQEGLILAKGLFQKIVIDCSTTKALNNDFVKKFSTMLQGPEGEMIFENPAKVNIPIMGVEETTFNTSNYVLSIPVTTVIEEYMGEDGEVDNDRIDRLAKEYTDKYFKTLYRNVEGLTIYPYSSNYEAKEPEQIKDPVACYKVSGLK